MSATLAAILTHLLSFFLIYYIRFCLWDLQLNLAFNFVLQKITLTLAYRKRIHLKRQSVSIIFQFNLMFVLVICVIVESAMVNMVFQIAVIILVMVTHIKFVVIAMSILFIWLLSCRVQVRHI